MSTERLSGENRPAEILLVEDNHDDVFLMRKAFEQSRFMVNLHWVENGQECLAFLNKEAGHEDKPTPDLILLDLNMPLMDGRETLRHIVQDDRLSHIPVIILTTSDNEKDIIASYKLRCSSYIVKPVDFEQFKRVLKDINRYWFTIVVLPEQDETD